MKTVTVLALLLLAMLLAGVVPATVGARPQTQAPAVPVFKEVATQVCTCQHSAQGASPYPETYLPANGFQPAPAYDEQLGTTFTQSFTALAFNVTAVEQTESSSGDGPAYLLNGLTPDGYWYQVGVSWNWNPGTIPGTGFDMNYEVFSPQQRSIFPLDGSGGLNSFSGTVNQGDSILLNLYFSSDQVMMVAHDWNTGASASESFSAEGATSFQGDSQDNANSNGFFTGLMTEWYHSQPFLANEKEVAYTESGSAISSAWLWMDEYNANARNPQSVFEAGTNGPLTFTSDPTKLQEFSSNGATEYMDASEFISGDMNGTAPTTVPLTLSYTVVGGGSGVSIPVLHYVSAGTHLNATLSTSPATYNVDLGSQWSVDNPLAGSATGERWQSDQQTNGTAESALTIALTYHHQFSALVSYAIVGGATAAPSFSYTAFGAAQKVTASTSGTTVWVDAGTAYAMTDPLSASNSERWLSADPVNGTAQSSVALSPTYFQQFLVEAQCSIIGGGSFPVTLSSTTVGRPINASLTTTPTPVWLDAGAPYTVTLKLGNATGSAPVTERWVANSTSGTVSLGLNIDPRYQHQFLVILRTNSAAGGTVSNSGGWYDAGSEVASTATASSGWKLEYWTSSTSLDQVVSPDQAISFQVNGPVNDTVVFYPGLTVSTGPDVSVSYSYPSGITGSGTVQGTVPAGSSEVVYVPPVGVTLSASPSSFLYSFAAWSGASSSRDASISPAISSPATITAESTYNYLDIGIILGGVILLIAIAATLAGSRSRKTVGSPAA